MRFQKSYNLLGQAAYILCRPLLRILIRRTTRAYVIITCEDQALVLRNWLSDQKWQLPGGGVGRRETPKSAVLRELHEELGIKLDEADIKLSSKGFWPGENLRYQYFIYIAQCSRKPALSRRKFEIIEARWVKISDFNSQNTSPAILSALPKAA